MFLFLLLTLFIITPSLLGGAAFALPVWPGSSGRKSWHGWPSVRYLFVFGDSYTTVGFNASTGPQPTAENPIGNPPYPGRTSANGPNWVDFMATTYNESLVLTYDLGFGGATIDTSIIRSTGSTVSMRSQVYDEFLPLYAERPTYAAWTPDASLFAFFIGINDVGNSYLDANASDEAEQDWTEYTVLVDTVYRSGARNFLFLNVPPVDRSPLTQQSGTKDQAVEKDAIAAWNRRLIALTRNLTSVYHDVTVFVFDTNKVFTAILDNPSTYTQTAGLRNVTDYCPAYENGIATTDTFISGCIYPVNEYFWLNTLHPTYPVHNATASQVVRILRDSGYSHGDHWG